MGSQPQFLLFMPDTDGGDRVTITAFQTTEKQINRVH